MSDTKVGWFFFFTSTDTTSYPNSPSLLDTEPVPEKRSKALGLDCELDIGKDVEGMTWGTGTGNGLDSTGAAMQSEVENALEPLFSAQGSTTSFKWQNILLEEDDSHGTLTVDELTGEGVGTKLDGVV